MPPASGEGPWLGIDIGGTKLAAGIVDSSGGVLQASHCATPVTSDAEELWQALVALVQGVTGGDALAGLGACGVGCGGPMSAGGVLVSPLNIPAWRGFPLGERLGALTGLATVVDNDAKALALSEGWVGAAAGQRNYLSMVVSTGVGGGIVIDGNLLGGASGNGGHIGHMIVEPDGRLCPCGARGCLEAHTSGPSILAITGRRPEDASLRTKQDAGRLVGRAVASVANLLDLRLATAGGSVALGFAEPFFQAAQEEIDRDCRLEFSSGTRIVPSALGRWGGVIGAAALARPPHARQA
ncbi:MAG: ROK family protein [Actinomycetota bacterium]